MVKKGFLHGHRIDAAFIDDVLETPPTPSMFDRFKSLGFAVGIIPFSWGLGPWVRPHKIAIALGPFRLFIYRSLKDWKSYEGAPRH